MVLINFKFKYYVANLFCLNFIFYIQNGDCFKFLSGYENGTSYKKNFKGIKVLFFYFT